MALFSSNRLSSIAVAESAEINSPANDNIDSSASVETSTEESFVAEEFDLDKIEESPNYFGLMESVINIHENDNKMFNTLLELDFYDVCAEQTLLESSNETKKGTSEGKKEGIKNNIKKVVKGTTNSITQAAKKLSNATEVYFSKDDKQIYGKYAKYITKENLEGFEGIKKFSFPTYNSDLAAEKVSDVDDIIKAINTAEDRIKKAENKGEVASAVDSFKVDLTEIRSNLNDEIKAAMTKHDNWIPSDSDIKFLTTFVDRNAAKKVINDTCAKTVSKLSIALNASSAVNFDDDLEISNAKYNAMYEVISAGMKMAIKKFNSYKALFTSEIAAIRKATIICGRYCRNKAEGKSTHTNEATLYAMMESSDIYVSDLFEKYTEGGNR